MKKEEESKKQPIEFIKEVKPESKFSKFLNMCKQHKAITISSSIGILIIVIIVVTIIIVSTGRKTNEVSNEDNIIENTTAEETSVEPEQDITLQTDTNGLADGTEVAIIKNDDGTVEVIAKDDPKFVEKTTGKNYYTGTIGNGGVKIKTNDNDLITIASKPQEEQKNTVKVENNTIPDTTVAEQQPETTTQTTDNNPSSTSSESTSKQSGDSGSSSSSKSSGGSSSSTKPSGSSSSSKKSSGNSGSSSSTKPSGGSSSSTKPSGSSSSSSSSGSSSSSKPAHTPFSTYSKYNASKTAQAVAWANEQLKADGYGAKAVTGDSSLKNKANGFSYVKSRIQNKVSEAWGTVKIYVEDIYMYDSSGTTANLFDTWVYVYEE